MSVFIPDTTFDGYEMYCSLCSERTRVSRKLSRETQDLMATVFCMKHQVCTLKYLKDTMERQYAKWARENIRP